MGKSARSLIYIVAVIAVLIIAAWGESWAASGWGAAANQAGSTSQAQQGLDGAASPGP